MKTLKLPGFLLVLVLSVTLSGCGPTYYNRPVYGRHYGYRRPYNQPPRPPRPYGNYGYGHPGW